MNGYHDVFIAVIGILGVLVGVLSFMVKAMWARVVSVSDALIAKQDAHIHSLKADNERKTEVIDRLDTRQQGVFKQERDDVASIKHTVENGLKNEIIEGVLNALKQR